MKKDQYAIGIDIGGTNTKMGIFDISGNLLAVKTQPTEKDLSAEDFIKLLSSECLTQLLPELKLIPGDQRILGVGVGAPMANYFSGGIESAPNLGWTKVPLKDYLENFFQLPSFIENDANLAALGEKQWGAGKNLSDFILLTLGTGVGSGLILDNNLYRGFNGLGAEGGHIIIPHDGNRPCTCGGVNHLESFLSARGIKQTIKEHIQEDWSLETLGTQFHQNNKQAVLIIQKIGTQLALGLSTMAVLFGPQAFIIGGGISKLGSKFNEVVLKKFNEIVHFSLRGKVQIVNSELSSGHGAIYGGAALVLNEVLKR